MAVWSAAMTLHTRRRQAWRHDGVSKRAAWRGDIRCGGAGGWHLPTRRRDDAERGGNYAVAANTATASAWDATAPSVAARRRQQARGEAQRHWTWGHRRVMMPSSASAAARPGRTGERTAEAGGRATTEEVEMAETELERLHGPAGNSSSPMHTTKRVRARHLARGHKKKAKT